MTLMTNKPYPMKITFLKDQPRIIYQEKQEKVSVTFLSSLIQQQKNNTHADNKDNILITDANVEDEHSIQQYSIAKSISRTTYEKWKKRKSLTQSEDKRLLTNLIGTDWVNHNNQEYSGFKLGKQNKNTIKERMETYHEEERNNVNRKLMETQFKTFLSEKKPKPMVIEPFQSKCVTTKLDERKIQSLKPSYMINHLRLNNLKHNAPRLIMPENTQMRSKQKKSSSMSLDQTNTKNHYRQQLNFKWSRLNNNNKFKLNDCS